MILLFVSKPVETCDNPLPVSYSRRRVKMAAFAGEGWRE
jgi:hypothetical protein